MSAHHFVSGLPVVGKLTSRSAAGTSSAPGELTGALPALFAVRWGAWTIAFVRVLFSDLPPDQARYEPALLALTFLQSVATTLYVPLIRPHIRAQSSDRRSGQHDLVLLGLLDVAAVLALVYFAGGFWNPYEEYVYASLIVPAFLLDRRAAFGLLGAFLAGLVAVVFVKAGTIDGPWFHGSVARFASLLVVPSLVVVSVQYLSQLTRRLQEQRERARAALAENAALQREREELAAQAERARIGREIHDGVAQSIYMLSLNLEKAAELEATTQLEGNLRNLVAIARAALLEVRQYIFDLKPLLQGQSGLVDVLRNQVKEFAAVSGLEAELQISGEEPRLPLEVASTLYRVAQEALANAFRHAEAKNVSLRICFEPETISLEVRDDGGGFEPGKAAGNGLQNMRHRIGALEGRVEVRSSRGQGTSVLVSLPLKATS